MTWPTSKWLSIVFAFLLVFGTSASDNSAEPSSYLQPKGGGAEDDKYDVIDVANQKSNDGLKKMMTGQTTRIILTGEVDDDFWLKHLGEDYKHAVHLMVGGRNDPQNPYRAQQNNYPELYGINSKTEIPTAKVEVKPDYHEAKIDVQQETKTEQHANYGDNQHVVTQTDDQLNSQINTEVKEPYELPEQVNETPKESPVENLENTENGESVETVTVTADNIAVTESVMNGNTNETHTPHTPTEYEPNNNTNDASLANTHTQDVKNDTAHVVPENPYPEDKSYAQIFAIGDKLANTFYNPNAFHIPIEKQHKNLHYTDTLHKYSTHNKYTHSDKPTQTKPLPTATATTTTTTTDDREHSGDGDHLDESDFSTSPHQKPVVINLPESAKSMVQQLSDSVTPVVVKMPPVIYHQKAKQYYRSSKAESTLKNTTPKNTAPNTQSNTPQQPQQTLSYPLSQKYAGFYSQPPTQQQQPQPYSPQQYPQYPTEYYNPIMANSYDQSSYTGQNFYPPSTPMSSEQTVDSIPALRYILGKTAPPIAPYADIHKQLQNNADPNLFDGYTRVSRSYRKYFNEGL